MHLIVSLFITVVVVVVVVVLVVVVVVVVVVLVVVVVVLVVVVVVVMVVVAAYENLESLLLKSLSNKSIANEIEYVKCIYKGDLNVDQLVVVMLKVICQNESFVCFEDV